MPKIGVMMVSSRIPFVYTLSSKFFLVLFQYNLSKMTIHNLYIFDRHCQCIYFQKWSHNNKSNNASTNLTSSNNTSNNNSQLGNSGSRLGGLATSSSRFSTSSATSSNAAESSPSLIRSGEDTTNQLQTTGITQQSGLAAGSVISIEEEAKLVYGVVLSLRNFVRKLSGK